MKEARNLKEFHDFLAECHPKRNAWMYEKIFAFFERLVNHFGHSLFPATMKIDTAGRVDIRFLGDGKELND